MNTFTITNGRIFDGNTFHEGLAVRITKGRIAEISAEAARTDGPVHDLEGRLLVPGFIDLQVNGGGGVLFNDDPTVDTLRTMAAAHRWFGSTGLLPTLIAWTLGTPLWIAMTR